MSARLSPKRPRGVTVFVILGILDGAAMAIFIAMFFATPEIYTELFPDDHWTDLSQYTVLSFNDWVVELGIIVIVIDCVTISGLLYAKPNGRKFACMGAVSAIVFNIITLGIPGMLVGVILLWYLSWCRTRNYFGCKP